jgi:hypothetical protein
MSKAYCVPEKLEAETQKQKERLLEITVGICPRDMNLEINPKTGRLSYLSIDQWGKEVWFEIPPEV